MLRDWNNLGVLHYVWAQTLPQLSDRSRHLEEARSYFRRALAAVDAQRPDEAEIGALIRRNYDALLVEANQSG